MHYVYIIKSIKFPEELYIGYTLDVQSRLVKHNQRGSVYTKDYVPWALMFYCAFPDKHLALEFEKYLKSHSGRAFMQKRFLGQVSLQI